MLNFTMRTYLYIVFFLLIGNVLKAQVDSVATDTSTQVVEKPTVLLKTNPIPILWGPILFTSEYKLAVEFPLKGKESISFMASYLGENVLVDINDTLLRENIDNTVTDANGDKYAWHVKSIGGYRMQFLYKHYIKNQAPRGFYMGPHISYSSVRYQVDWEPVGNSKGQNPEGGNPTDYLSISYLNFNAIAGYQTFGGKYFAFDMYAGLGVNQRSVVSSYEAPAFDEQLKESSGIVPKLILGFTLGVAIY